MTSNFFDYLNNNKLNKNKTKLIVETILNNKNFNNNMMLLPLDMNLMNELNMLLNELRHIRPDELERIIKKIVKEVLRDPKFNIHKAKKIASKIESIPSSVIPPVGVIPGIILSVIPRDFSVPVSDTTTTEMSVGGILNSSIPRGMPSHELGSNLTTVDLTTVDLGSWSHLVPSTGSPSTTLVPNLVPNLVPSTALVPSPATTMNPELDTEVALFLGKPSMDPEIGNALALLQKHTLALPKTDTKAHELALKNIGIMAKQIMELDVKRTKDTTFLTGKFQVKFSKVADLSNIMRKIAVFLNPLNLKLLETGSSTNPGQMILYNSNGNQITLSRTTIKSSVEITRTLAAAFVVGGPLTTQLQALTGYEPRELARVLKDGVSVEAKKMFQTIGIRNLASSVRKNMPAGIDIRAQINIMGATVLRELLPFLVNKDIKNAEGLAHFSFSDLLIEAGVSPSNTNVLLQFLESNNQMLYIKNKSDKSVSKISKETIQETIQETIPIDEANITAFVEMLLALFNRLQVNNPMIEQKPLQLTSMTDLQSLLLLEHKTHTSITPISAASSSATIATTSVDIVGVMENYGAIVTVVQSAAAMNEETHKMELGDIYDEIKEKPMVDWDELKAELTNIVKLKSDITLLFDNHRMETGTDTFNRTNKKFNLLARLLMQLKAKVSRVYNFFKVKNSEAISNITDLSDFGDFDISVQPLEKSTKKGSTLVEIKENYKKIIKTINELIAIHKGERIIKPVNPTKTSILSPDEPSKLSSFTSSISSLLGLSEEKPKENPKKPPHVFNDPLENIWRNQHNLHAIANFIIKSDRVFDNQENLIGFTKKYNVDYNKKYLTYKQKYLKLKEILNKH